MTFCRNHMSLFAAISWISLTLPSSAQNCGEEIKVPYRLQTCDGHSAEHAIAISYSEAFANAISMPPFIHSAKPENGRVDVRVVVMPSGAIAGVTQVSGDPQWYDRAAALVNTWRFKPFRSHGSGIYIRFSSILRIVPPERRPEQHRPLPEIKDWNSVRITLRRTACRGGCTAYKLTIFGDGRALYQGDSEFSNQPWKESRGHVSPKVVRQLVDLFRSADYFNLFDRYGRAYDAPDFITSISFDGNSKSVVDEVGYYEGMPDIVGSLENEIDRLAGPMVWQARRQKRAQNNVGD